MAENFPLGRNDKFAEIIFYFLRADAYCRFSYAGNRELAKSILGTKSRRSRVCLHPQARNRLWQLMVLLFFVNVYTKTDTGDKIKYRRIPKNTETQQENTKENTIKTTEIDWDWSKKISWLVLMKTCEISLLLIGKFSKWG